MLRIRRERPDDLSGVRLVNERAFGQSGEAELVDALRGTVEPFISLVAEGVTVQEALEQIVIATGLAYEAGDREIMLYRPPATGGMTVVGDPRGGETGRGATSDQPSRRPRDPIVGKVIVTSPDGN